MIGATITLYTDGNGGTEKVLNRVRDDGYGAEYYLRETDGSYRAIIRHSSSKGRDRHYVEIQREVFATTTAEAQFAKASFVLESTPSFASTAMSAVACPLTTRLGCTVESSIFPNLIGWDS